MNEYSEKLIVFNSLQGTNVMFNKNDVKLENDLLRRNINATKYRTAIGYWPRLFI
jgi:hypothetical protein